MSRLENNFGIYLKNSRNGKNISVRGLAEKSGVSHGYISQIENGDKQPSKDIVKKLANALSAPINEMLVLAGYAKELSPKEILMQKHQEQLLNIRVASEALKTLNKELSKAKSEKNIDRISRLEEKIEEEKKKLSVHRALEGAYVDELVKLEDLTQRDIDTINGSRPEKVTERIDLTFKVPRIISEEDDSVIIKRTLSEQEALTRFFDLKNLMTVLEYVNYNGHHIDSDKKEQIIKMLDSIFQ